MNIFPYIVKRISVGTFSLILISALSSTAMAALLGSHTVSGPNQSLAPEFTIELAYREGGMLNPGVSYTPFGTIDIIAGNVYTVNSGSEFNGAVELLTNGIDNYVGDHLTVISLPGSLYNDIIFFVEGGINRGLPDPRMEKESIKLSGPGISAVDFNGYIIEEMQLTILNFTGWYLDDTLYTFDDLTYKVEYFGTPVPIPSTIWLLGSGIIGMVGIVRKFRKK